MNREQQIRQLAQEEQHFKHVFEEMIEGWAATQNTVDQAAKWAFLNRPDVREITETLSNRQAAIQRLGGLFTISVTANPELSVRAKCSICAKIFLNQQPACRYCDTSMTCRPRVEGGVL